MGEHLLNFWRLLLNTVQQAAIVEAPAVMTAAGHKINRTTKKVEYNHASDEDVKQLRSNLTAIGEAGVNAPGAAKALELGYNIVRHPKQTYKAIKHAVSYLGRLVKPMVNEAALAIENYRYPLGRPQVPEGYLTIKPQVRTRVGDVEIDNPNLLYHLDRGNGAGAFSNQGAYIEDGFLFPGTPKDASAIPYSWWNKGKPYATHVEDQPMTRLTTATEETPGMLHVRSQDYPIGQWNGKNGFVLNSEYVNPEGVDVTGNTYTLDPNYGWRKVFPKETSVAEWDMGKIAPQITAENAARMTPSQWTAAQDAAIARGDMAEAQRLRDLHFKVSAPNTKIVDAEGMPQHVYHGTASKPFTVFDINAPRKHDLGTYGKGFYFTPNKNTAINYGEGKTLFDSYLNLKTPYLGSEDVVDNVGNFKNLKELKNYYKQQGFSEDELNNIDWGNFDVTDGVNAGDEIVVLRPNQIKSADAVTYDDKGVRIPLGERDNFNINDIRYSWLAPFTGLGTLGTMYGTSKRKR